MCRSKKWKRFSRKTIFLRAFKYRRIEDFDIIIDLVCGASDVLNAIITALINTKSAKLDKIKFIGIDTEMTIWEN